MSDTPPQSVQDPSSISLHRYRERMVDLVDQLVQLDPSALALFARNPPFVVEHTTGGSAATFSPWSRICAYFKEQNTNQMRKGAFGAEMAYFDAPAVLEALMEWWFRNDPEASVVYHPNERMAAFILRNYARLPRVQPSLEPEPGAFNDSDEELLDATSASS